MEGSEYLYTIAEVSVAFVGFAAIAIAIRHRTDGLDDFGRMLVTALVERGLAALAFAFIPIQLHYFGLSSETILPFCSGLLAFYLLTVFIRMYFIFRKHTTDVPVGTVGRVQRLTIVGIMVPVQSLAAFGVLPLSALGWYLLGVTWLLVISGGLFATILVTRAS